MKNLDWVSAPVAFFAIVAVSGTAAALASAQQLPSYIEKPSDAAGVFAIWPGVPPGSEKATWHEQTTQPPGSKVPNHMVRNIATPTVAMFKPAPRTANGTALIVAPGGAFSFLMVDYEGYDMARWLAQLGVTAFVLRYRVQHTPDNDAELPVFMQQLGKDLAHPGPGVEAPPTGTKTMEEARGWAEEDGRQAIRFVREHAHEFGVDPNRIGIAGFSAGGGVVMGAVMQHDAKSLPNFAAPIYPAYRAGPVPADAPPIFIALADDDSLIAPISGARLYEAWHAAGKSAELHIFAHGEHGFGMKKQDLGSDAWIELFKTWMGKQGLLSGGAGR